MINREFGDLVTRYSETVPATVKEKTATYVTVALSAMGRRLQTALESGDLPEIASSIIFEGKDLNFSIKTRLLLTPCLFIILFIPQDYKETGSFFIDNFLKF